MDLAALEIFFLACAIIGGVLFLFRMVLFFMGGDGDFDGDMGDVDFGDTDVSFQFFSLQGLTAAFMMFGLVALAVSRGGWSGIWAVSGGVLAAAITVWVISRIFTGMKRLQSDGTLKYDNAVGKEGKVYLTIPVDGTGKVTVAVQGSLREFSARSDLDEEIKTGEIIRVVDITSGDILVVEKLG